MRRRTLAPILIALAWLALTALPAGAQAPGVQVRVRDLRGAGVPGVTITLDDATGRTSLARQATDAQGVATFAALPTTTVCLRLSGALADTTPIRLSESSFADRDALLVRTDVGSPLVALVVDAHGRAVLDPATFDREGESGAAPQPTPRPTATPTAGHPTDDRPAWSPTVPLGIAIVAGLLLLAMGRSAPHERRWP